MTEEKKSLFDKAVDALTNRDEKAAAEAAKKEAEAARLQAEAARATLAKAQAEAAAAKQARAAQAQAVLAQAERMKEIAEVQKKQADAAAAAAAIAAAAAVVKHVWTKDDTYASLALKHYGSFKEPYWRLIYEHNKEKIGNHPNDIRVGLEIEIPPLPAELKDK